MRRREFITLLGSAAAWPRSARAQQPHMPVIGFLTTSVRTRTQQISAFHTGLKQSGFVAGQNVAMEFRSAEGQFDRFSALADDLVRQHVGRAGCTQQRRGARRETGDLDYSDRLRDGR
jgi:putative ABC transport system substrate-binding protein